MLRYTAWIPRRAIGTPNRRLLSAASRTAAVTWTCEPSCVWRRVRNVRSVGSGEYGVTSNRHKVDLTETATRLGSWKRKNIVRFGLSFALRLPSRAGRYFGSAAKPAGPIPCVATVSVAVLELFSSDAGVSARRGPILRSSEDLPAADDQSWRRREAFFAHIGEVPMALQQTPALALWRWRLGQGNFE
jgi:hypothetical protein